MKLKILLFLSFSLISFSCQSDFSAEKNKRDIIRSVETADSIIIYQSDRAINKWTLHAQKMKKFTEENILYFYLLKLEIMDSNGEISSTIFADSAKINNNKDVITANGNIKIYTREGDLFGNSLVWNRNIGKIISNERVKVIKDGNTIWGDKFESDARFEHVVLFQASAQGEVSDSTKIW